jgi:hypothetical protein
MVSCLPLAGKSMKPRNVGPEKFVGYLVESDKLFLTNMAFYLEDKTAALLMTNNSSSLFIYF